MYLKSLELSGFKSFGKKSTLEFPSSIAAIVGPNGSGKSNIAEAFRFVLGEQSIKSMRGKRGEDLIFNGSTSVPRLNRASVKAVFDNHDRLFTIDFDEVAIERVVHRDGVNEYSINGSAVRLRDVMELLANANIGSSGHHIISQGEADRILSASPKERKEMLEDALGLKAYQYKKMESVKKLQKTKENIAHIQSLRTEIAPHLRFLERQVQKLQRARTLRDELSSLYKDYLSREHLFLTYEKERIEKVKEEPQTKLREVSVELSRARVLLERSEKLDSSGKEQLAIEDTLTRARREHDTLMRELGHLEARIALEEERQVREEKRAEREKARTVSLEKVKTLLDDLKEQATEAHKSEEVGVLRRALTHMVEKIQSFMHHASAEAHHEMERTEKELARLKGEKEQVDKSVSDLSQDIEKLQEQYRGLGEERATKEHESREAERTVFTLMSMQRDLEVVLNKLVLEEDQLTRIKEEFDREYREGRALLGASVDTYKELKAEETSTLLAAIIKEGRGAQEERRRTLEKIKIRLEELGGASTDEIMKEYSEAKGRDDFLGKEINDLEQSAASLEHLIGELDEQLKQRFAKGIEQIGKEFQSFFALMFGGGSATLLVVRQKRRIISEEEIDLEESESLDTEGEEGIEIDVSLPHKRTKGLMMLSGGERALTSIALIFAMSQVNPPPFLLLDETDAALDEANSRRYGDMIENLAKKSQLILITHNRETMSRAGILYGVTMGSDGVSKLLSVKFEEAVAVAK